MRQPRKIYIDLDAEEGERVIRETDSFLEIYAVQPDGEKYAKMVSAIAMSGKENIVTFSDIREVFQKTNVGLIRLPETMSLSQVKPIMEKNPGVKIMIGDYPLREKEERDWYESYRSAITLRIGSNYKEAFKYLEEADKKLEEDSEKRYLLDYEKAYTCYYCDKREMGFKAIDDLVFSHFAAWSLKNQIMDVAKFYVKPIETLGSINISFPVPTPYIGSSPSLIKRGENFYLNIRGVNYSIVQANGSYVIRDPANFVRTRNFLYKLDSDFKEQSEVELIDRSGISKYSHHIKGLEDLRLFTSTEFFCTNLEVIESKTPQICYGKIEEDGTVENMVRLNISNNCEKNWLPFKIDDVTYFIYGFEPFRVYKIPSYSSGDSEVKPILVYKKFVRNENIESFRGSASPIEYRDGFLCTIHQVMYGNPRRYYHRFVWFSRDFKTLNFGKMYCFETPEIEFNLSLCLHNDELLMTYSRWDNSTQLIRVGLDKIDV